MLDLNYLVKQNGRIEFRVTMNKLDRKSRAQILGMMVEGMSIQSITRLTGASKNTVAKLLKDAGEAFIAYHDEHVRGLKSKRIQCDEIWSFVGKKEKNLRSYDEKMAGLGDAWTWTAIDSESKLIASWAVGRRDAFTARDFMRDLASRVDSRVQLTTDGFKAYLNAVSGAFGAACFAEFVSYLGELFPGLLVDRWFE